LQDSVSNKRPRLSNDPGEDTPQEDNQDLDSREAGTGGIDALQDHMLLAENTRGRIGSASNSLKGESVTYKDTTDAEDAANGLLRLKERIRQLEEEARTTQQRHAAECSELLESYDLDTKNKVQGIGDKGEKWEKEKAVAAEQIATLQKQFSVFKQDAAKAEANRTAELEMHRRHAAEQQQASQDEITLLKRQIKDQERSCSEEKEVSKKRYNELESTSNDKIEKWRKRYLAAQKAIDTVRGRDSDLRVGHDWPPSLGESSLHLA
jgi:hypothetical protein